jgi:hypothetical protein
MFSTAYSICFGSKRTLRFKPQLCEAFSLIGIGSLKHGKINPYSISELWKINRTASIRH